MLRPPQGARRGVSRRGREGGREGEAGKARPRRARTCGACASSCNARAPPGVDRALNLSWTRIDSDGSAGCDGTVAPSSLRAALFLLKFPAASCPLRHNITAPFPPAAPYCLANLLSRAVSFGSDGQTRQRAAGRRSASARTWRGARHAARGAGSESSRPAGTTPRDEGVGGSQNFRARRACVWVADASSRRRPRPYAFRTQMHAHTRPRTRKPARMSSLPSPPQRVSPPPQRSRLTPSRMCMCGVISCVRACVRAQVLCAPGPQGAGRRGGFRRPRAAPPGRAARESRSLCARVRATCARSAPSGSPG